MFPKFFKSSFLTTTLNQMFSTVYADISGPKKAQKHADGKQCGYS